MAPPHSHSLSPSHECLTPRRHNSLTQARTHAHTHLSLTWPPGPRAPAQSNKMLTMGLRCRHLRAKSSLCPRSGWRVTTPSASAPLIWSWQTPASLRSITPGVCVCVCVSLSLSLSLSLNLTLPTPRVSPLQGARPRGGGSHAGEFFARDAGALDPKERLAFPRARARQGGAGAKESENLYVKMQEIAANFHSTTYFLQPAMVFSHRCAEERINDQIAKNPVMPLQVRS